MSSCRTRSSDFPGMRQSQPGRRNTAAPPRYRTGCAQPVWGCRAAAHAATWHTPPGCGPHRARAGLACTGQPVATFAPQARIEGVLQKSAGVSPGRMRFMSRKYLPVNREKPMFLPLDMQSWVPKDHFVWFLVDVVRQLDSSALQAGTSPGRGRPGYDPQMLAALVMYAMSCGVRSSREIEDRARTDAGFRVASAGQFPDHSTLCRFRQRTGGEDGPLEDLFTQVLYVCAVAGLGRLRVISVDGSKIWADASKEANRTLQGLRKLSRKVLEEAAAADGDCGCDGHGHGEAAGGGGGDGCGCCDGGMLPGLGLCGPVVLPAGWGGASRNERIAAALADLEAAREAQDAARRAAASGTMAMMVARNDVSVARFGSSRVARYSSIGVVVAIWPVPPSDTTDARPGRTCAGFAGVVAGPLQ